MLYMFEKLYILYTYALMCRQTGAGKSFTMEGTPSNPGVNTRALAALFELAAARTTDVEYRSVTVTFWRYFYGNFDRYNYR
jgi:Kinesin motor domain